MTMEMTMDTLISSNGAWFGVSKQMIWLLRSNSISPDFQNALVLTHDNKSNIIDNFKNYLMDKVQTEISQRIQFTF